MATSRGGPRRGRGAPRSALPGRDRLIERKKRNSRRQADDGVANGLVEIPGPLSARAVSEVRAVARATERRERRRDPGAFVLRIAAFEQGLAIETESEKLAQHIADALARSQGASVRRVFDDEGRRRILTCRLPDRGKE